MKFLLALVVWFIMGAIIATGVVMAVNGKPWLLVLSVLGFFAAMAKIGCLQH